MEVGGSEILDVEQSVQPKSKVRFQHNDPPKSAPSGSSAGVNSSAESINTSS